MDETVRDIQRRCIHRLRPPPSIDVRLRVQSRPMTGDLLTLSTREMVTLAIITRLAKRRMTQTEAARCLGRSERQVRRLLRAFERDGPAGLSDKRRGRPAPNRIPKAYREYVLALVRERYRDFGPTFASEKLQEYHDIRVATETLRKWMIADGIWKTRAQRRKRVQQPRHRRDCYGELVQIDGSDHHWFEDRGPRCVLLVYVDDATGKLMALRMCESESAFSYFHATRSYLQRHGKPVALYSDKAGVFRVNAKRPKAGDGFTQFGRAMSDLNIDVICANTPAAKGRVERAHQTLQDRLVKELRLRGISTMDEANRYLPEFMDDYNRRFGRVARNDHDAHRPLTELPPAAGPRIQGHALDLSDRDSVERFVRWFIDARGNRLDILANNAGVRRPIEHGGFPTFLGTDAPVD